MPQVTVSKCRSQETAPQTLILQMEAITDLIRDRAFHVFLERNGNHGSAVADWLKAERECIFSPPSELLEDEKGFSARVAVPGLDEKDIRVSVLPDAIVIQAETTHTHDGRTCDVCFCEFSGKQLFRRLDLPASIDIDKVRASVDKRILRVTAPKAPARQMSAGA